ncbi:MAG: TonB-dependent receptor [Candidatus Omnitrophica bacterium]|nr:TonB-dependent receptor [Candidatus Omnitrophota bacterium]
MRSSYKKFAGLGLMYFISLGIAYADDVELDKIVVTPSGVEESSGSVGRTVDVITSKDMEKSGAQNLSDVLTGLTSVDMSSYGGPNAVENIRMRGSTSSQVLVLMDGRPINNPRDGSADLTTIPLDNISRVEVMHGPGSSLYGSSAMGGVVNIITKNPPKKGQKAELYSSFGTARTYIERMLYGADISKFNFLISGGYLSSVGFRENSEINAEDCNLKLGYDFNNENNLKLNSGFYKSKSGAPGKTTWLDLDDKQDTLKRFFDLSWSLKPDTKTALSARVYQNYDRLEFMENSSDGWNPDNKKDIQATTVRGFNLQLDEQLWDIYKIVAGYNYVGNFNNSTTSGKHKYNVNAGYLENILDLFDKKLNINLSVRLDDYSNFGLATDPSLSMLYKFNDSVRIHALVARSFRVPTFNDLYNSIPGMGVSNPNLVPEKGMTGELGVESRINKYLNTSLTYYRSDYKQLIEWVEADPEWQVMNVNSAVINGIEFGNKIYISDNFDLNINYTYMLAKDAKTHKYLVYQPENKVDAGLKYNDHNGLTVEFKGQYTGVRFGDVDNANKVKSFYVFGLSVHKKFKRNLTCFAYIDNLFNRKYEVQAGYPMPGFSLTGGLKLDF